MDGLGLSLGWWDGHHVFGVFVTERVSLEPKRRHRQLLREQKPLFGV